MKLYKYLIPERTDILDNCSLRFTQAQDFNDPFEVLPNIDAIMPPEKLRGYLAQFEDGMRRDFDVMVREKLTEAGLPEELSILLPYESLKAMGLDFVGFTERLLPTLLTTERERFSTRIQQTTGERIGILSLSENPTSLLMWAHYAASHHGFALEFDSAHSFFNQQRKPKEVVRHLLPVAYSADRPAITMFDPEADNDTWGQRLVAEAFLTKSTDWSYEKEWRMFMPLEDPTHPHSVLGRIHLFPFPAEALTAVILGARCDDVTRVRIEKILTTRREWAHIELRVATISTTKFEVLIGPNLYVG